MSWSLYSISRQHLAARVDRKGRDRKLLTLFYLIYGVDVCHAVFDDTANFFETLVRAHHGDRIS